MSEPNDYRVLMVEDDDGISELFQEAFKNAFDVERVSYASDGLKRLQEAAPIDAVLLDLILPNGMGVSLVNRFQAANPEVPIIVLTGHDFPADTLIMAGAQEVLYKPEAIETIISTIGRAIVRHKVRSTFRPFERREQEIRQTVEKLVKA